MSTFEAIGTKAEGVWGWYRSLHWTRKFWVIFFAMVALGAVLPKTPQPAPYQAPAPVHVGAGMKTWAQEDAEMERELQARAQRKALAAGPHILAAKTHLVSNYTNVHFGRVWYSGQDGVVCGDVSANNRLGFSAGIKHFVFHDGFAEMFDGATNDPRPGYWNMYCQMTR